MAPNELTSLAQRVLWARKVSGLTGSLLEHLAGLSQATIYKVETDNRMPGGDALLRMSRVLGLSVEWLIEGSGETPTLDQVAVAVARARAADDETALKPTGSEE